jgi:acetate kinase
VCRGLGILGVELDDEANLAPGGGERRISTDASAVAVLVVPTNEELEIARQAAALVSGG